MIYLELSDREFTSFRELVYQKCGIHLHNGKKELVRARLGKRLRQTEFKSFKQYYKFLIHNDTGEELIEMLNAISTNQTSFFRESGHFDFLTKECLPSYHKIGNLSDLKIWSAGCSSGEEPYSIAICLLEQLEINAPWKIKILSTDISTRVLETARSGIYHQSRIDNIPKYILKKYFQCGRGKWEKYFRLKSVIRNIVEFERLNLMEPFIFKVKFNIIFCRNVMIYFDKITQQSLISKFFDSLAEGGYLFIGHSESLMGIKHDFQYVKPTVYLKPKNL
ncbi:MAG: protein-glutamate O-methyltransferase [Desulfobacterales bacterium]|nr:protein-glutamate O-methyltransferase [Desulfobacterales bacterium]